MFLFSTIRCGLVVGADAVLESGAAEDLLLKNPPRLSLGEELIGFSS